MIGHLATIALLGTTGWLPSGHRWATGSLPVPYCITSNGTNTNLSSAQQRTAITNAINSWRNAPGGTLSCTTYDAVAQPAANCSAQRNGNDGQNNIFFRSNWQNGSGTIGVTWSVFFNNCGSVTNDTGQTYQLDCNFDADIEYNDQHYFWTADGTATDLESITVHEYGHFIGLDHCDTNGTCNFGNGVMYSAYQPGTTVRTLRNDDVQGGCGLYPGTPGGLGWPCANNQACSGAPICVNAGNNGYCTQTCGSCPSGYICGANPQNMAQMVCLRDDGLNRGLCEVCQGGVPNACANNGQCFTGLPERNLGRCVTPCPNPAAVDGACPTNYTCYNVSGDDLCFPKSSDCTDLTNFTELQMGQPCNGNPTCVAGLTCVGICAQECTGNPNSCPANYGCEEFVSGDSFCLPSVREGQSCAGLTSCTVGPCLSASGSGPLCYLDCAGNPGACNNAQMCTTYNLQGGGSVSICEPPGVPPRPDAGLPPDTGLHPDAAPTCPCDQTASCDPGCPCDPSCGGAPDGGIVNPGDDAGPNPGADAGPNPNRPDAGTDPMGCPCDETFACDPGCATCDPECQCSCDQTYSCDEGCEDCDPECQDNRASCGSCTSTEGPVGPLQSPIMLLALIFLAGGLLGVRRYLR